MRESEIQAAIRRALGRVPGLAMVRNNVGLDTGRSGRPVRYGLGPGSPDLVGLLTVDEGVALAFGIEVKSAGGRLSKAQRLWHAQAARRGMPVFVCRRPLAAVSEVKGWIVMLVDNGYQISSKTREHFGI